MGKMPTHKDVDRAFREAIEGASQQVEVPTLVSRIRNRLGMARRPEEQEEA